ncbi:DinB family protein [Bacillaceae bacterium CLA-AA-H227]|uniref:DinB family protein n=1 Tax=Robertmurraya yapensis (ex Hitch et al 2024) TaxID=3133160 RepID=A0ACC6SHC7_9BACI
MELFATQYTWIQKSRELLFRYCETMSPEDYVKEHDSFGGDSILSLHAHVADCYRVWLGTRALGKSLTAIRPDSINNVQEMRKVYSQTDELVYEFLREFNGKWEQSVPVTFENGSRVEFTALWLFTHTITHEFHHKGQIVKIGRQLGYIPPDTDLIDPRF